VEDGKSNTETKVTTKVYACRRCWDTLQSAAAQQVLSRATAVVLRIIAPRVSRFLARSLSLSLEEPAKGSLRSLSPSLSLPLPCSLSDAAHSTSTG